MTHVMNYAAVVQSRSRKLSIIAYEELNILSVVIST